MTGKHTPGPWSIYRTADGHNVLGVGDADGGGITDAFGGFWGSGSEKRANIDLVCAAPDLLEAVEAFLTRWDCGDPVGTAYVEDLMRKARAKATGGEK